MTGWMRAITIHVSYTIYRGGSVDAWSVDASSAKGRMSLHLCYFGF